MPASFMPHSVADEGPSTLVKDVAAASRSKRRRGQEGQIELALPQRMQQVDHALLVRQPSLLAAIKLCITLAGFDADKEVYMHLGIDAGHWSRILRGEAHFPVDRLCDLMDLCGNEAPLLWLLHARGYDLHSLRRQETEIERELRQARDEIARMQAERTAERNLLADVLGRRQP